MAQSKVVFNWVLWMPQKKPEDLDVPGFKFHTLHGNPKRYSIWVTGNYRITFEWDGHDRMHERKTTEGTDSSRISSARRCFT